ncbi:MAG: Rpn family recombination-promoting nuclease/putative transposase [Spirochaetaceae bacterium]|nr:Rpn family recombination-promoting nuclease/putative transposase [Spirochaetaceae bacterium]
MSGGPKNSVFTLLFSDEARLRELYYALTGIKLATDTPLIINTLEDIFYMGRVNDISFEADGKLVVLIEHQSTINPNMPLRLLLYIARLYEKMASGKKVYTRKLITLPRPQFFVLYNGKEPLDQEVMRLSESFANTTFESRNLLELEVKVININYGQNDTIVRQSATLYGYSAFIYKVQEYIKEGNSLEKATELAVDYCLSHEILQEFLDKHLEEVKNMLTQEWNLEEAKEVWFEEGLERGLEKTARNMLKIGLSPDIIAKATTLTIEAIEKLKD